MAQYLIPKARNRRTGETVMEQDLAGVRLELRQRALALRQAQALADKMSRKTDDVWYGFVDVYSSSSPRY